MEGERWTVWDARDTCPKEVKKEKQGERQSKERSTGNGTMQRTNAHRDMKGKLWDK